MDALIEDTAANRANDVAVFKMTADILSRHYPDWSFYITVHNGRVTIINQLLNEGRNLQLGVNLYYERVMSATAWAHKVITEVGRELEAFGFKRGAFNVEDWLSRPRDFAGRLSFDNAILDNKS